MSIQASPDTVTRELLRLAVKERAISRRRRALHQEIDDLYLTAPLDADTAARLDRLEERERSISRERRQLHERIDELRAQIGLPRWRDRHDVEGAA